MYSVEHSSEEMQSSFHELSTPEADSVYVNIYQKNSFANAGNDDISGIKHASDFTSVGFQSHLEKSRVFSFTKELLYSKVDCG